MGCNGYGGGGCSAVQCGKFDANEGAKYGDVYHRVCFFFHWVRFAFDHFFLFCLFPSPILARKAVDMLVLCSREGRDRRAMGIIDGGGQGDPPLASSSALFSGKRGVYPPNARVSKAKGRFKVPSVGLRQRDGEGEGGFPRRHVLFTNVASLWGRRNVQTIFVSVEPCLVLPARLFECPVLV